MDTVSDWDREYMKRLGRYKAEANQAAEDLHLARTPADRITTAMRMSDEYRRRDHERLVADREDDNPAEFYAKARALGLIRSRPRST